MMNVKTLDVFTRELPFEINDDDSTHGDGRTFSGYAAVFNSVTRIDSMWEGTFDEEILPGAFQETLRKKTPVFQFDHGRHATIGSIPLGTITKAEEDARGLYVEARLLNNPFVDWVRDAISAGAINGMSFRFSVPEGGEKWVEVSGQVPQRTLSKLDVPELGPVVFPAYEKTTASVRGLLGLDVIENELAGRSDTRSTDGGNKSEEVDPVLLRKRMAREKIMRKLRMTTIR
jgi:hypothetical protein